MSDEMNVGSDKKSEYTIRIIVVAVLSLVLAVSITWYMKGGRTPSRAHTAPNSAMVPQKAALTLNGASAAGNAAIERLGLASSAKGYQLLRYGVSDVATKKKNIHANFHSFTFASQPFIVVTVVEPKHGGALVMKNDLDRDVAILTRRCKNKAGIIDFEDVAVRKFVSSCRNNRHIDRVSFKYRNMYYAVSVMAPHELRDKNEVDNFAKRILAE